MTTKRPYMIVAGVDGSESQYAILQRALDVATRHQPAEIHVVRVVDISPGVFHHGHQGQVDAAHSEVVDLIKETVEDFGHDVDGDDSPPWQVRAHGRAGEAANEILELAAEVEADVIVIGRHGQGGRGKPKIGRVPSQVVARAACPVLVERALEYELREESAGDCEACATTRKESEGSVWFCRDHTDERAFKCTTIVRMPTMLLHGVY